MPHAALRLGGGIRSVIEATWDELGIAPHVAASAANFSALMFKVTESPVLIATVQRRLALQFKRPVRINALKADMHWHKSREADPAHLYLRTVFAQAALGDGA